MCVVIGKYFEDYGWIGIKHRDRNYTPTITFKKKNYNDVEVLYFWDTITQWCEGVNSHGVSILSASLMVSDDEKEYKTCSEKKPSITGKKIQKILKYSDLEKVVEQAIQEKLTGNTLIFNKDRMFLLEGAWKPGEYVTQGFYFKVEEIPKTDIVVRTNHGIWLPGTGYQKEDNLKNRISSELRYIYSELMAHKSENHLDLLEKLMQKIENDPQLNPLRVVKQEHDMRTTSQIMIVPKHNTMYVRQLEGDIKYDHKKLNNLNSQVWVELLSNRIEMFEKTVFSPII
jgi:hypothetical protein